MDQGTSTHAQIPPPVAPSTKAKSQRRIDFEKLAKSVRGMESYVQLLSKRQQYFNTQSQKSEDLAVAQCFEQLSRDTEPILQMAEKWSHKMAIDYYNRICFPQRYYG
ncbi:MAG: hypothetical protein Q9216_006034 [Gyalolechia sp. 2 TL-2023]